MEFSNELFDGAGVFAINEKVDPKKEKFPYSDHTLLFNLHFLIISRMSKKILLDSAATFLRPGNSPKH